MQIQTVLLIILAAFVALGIVLFQYHYKTKKQGRLGLAFSILRFITLFGVFLLLINPKFIKNEFTLEKPDLIVLVDNSSSMLNTNEQGEIVKITQQFKKKGILSEKFNTRFYSFGASLNPSDSTTFTEKTTNISSALSSIQEAYNGANKAVVLLTDGNQTYGEDYEFDAKRLNFPVYPIAMGDTTRYEDVRIGQVNVNKYAFLKNQFPLEAYINYEGKKDLTTTLQVTVDGKPVYKEAVSFSATANSKTIKILLKAGSVGVKNIKVSVAAIKNERNTRNNHKDLAIEVIDEKTNVAIVSDLVHPDLGTLKKAIESNEQRSVSIIKPNADPSDLENVALFILYQPNSSFKKIYDYIQLKKANVFTITGTHTDWNFLNKVQNEFTGNDGYPVQDVFPVVNLGFSKFDISDFSVDDFPPLESNAGDIKMDIPNETLLRMKVKGLEMPTPLLTLFDSATGRQALLLGEHIWKWRMQSYRNDQNFKNFDGFIGKLMLYLTTTKPKNRLEVDYKPLYKGGQDAKLTATYFDEALVFNPKATLNLLLKGKDNSVSKEIPMRLKEGYYEADLSDLPFGNYTFTVTVAHKAISRSGSFTILDFDVEKQFLSTDYQKLERLAAATNGKLFFPSTADVLLKELSTDDSYLPIQKGREIVVSLIDFKWILGILILSLAIEWFLRKYNGLT